jgi:hypothetical protein
MTPVEYVSASLHTELTLLVFSVFIFYFWRQYRLDALREKLFELRGELFNYASSRAVSFDDPAYAKLRVVMNIMIRFAHKFTFSRVALIFLFRRVFENLHLDNPLAEWQRAVSTLPEDRQKILRTLHDRMMATIVWHVTSGSPVLLVIFFWYALRFFASGKARRLDEVSKHLPGVEIVEAQAVNAQLEEECSLEPMPA